MHIRPTFAINGVTVDLGNEMVRDRSGDQIVLRPQTFAVLRHLVTHADTLVTKAELMAAVWPGLAVTDDSLVQCIHQVRRALRDDGHAILKTVPKRGYRLVLTPDAWAETDAIPAPVAASGYGRLANIASALTGIVLIGAIGWWLSNSPKTTDSSNEETPAIAVLPFENIGGDPSQAYFAEGVTEDLITDLSRISGILVIARNSVWTYRNKAIAAETVAKRLGARYLLEGSVRREGDNVRINAQLIDTAYDHQLWADRYDGRLTDVFALQNKVVANIISALAVKLTIGGVPETDGTETTNPQAYDAMLLGLAHLHLDTEEETLKAIKLFKNAVKLDPNYGRAYATIAAAQLRIIQSNWFTTGGAELDKVEAGLRFSLAKAMENPTALAYSVAAVLAVENGRKNDAFTLIDQAKARSPGDPELLVNNAFILNATGRAAEAETELRLSMRLDPNFSSVTLRALSVALFQEAKYWEAIDTVQRIKAQSATTRSDYVTLVASLGQLGLKDGVKEAIDRYNELAVPAGFDPMSVQEAQWYWHGDLFNYYRPYVDKLAEGLRKAGVWEGAGVDVPLDRYKALINQGPDGEFDVEGATEVDAVTAGALFDRGARFIDVRPEASFLKGHIPGAINLSLALALTREELTKVVDPKDEVLFYCHSKYCEYSAIASAKAINWGYKKVYWLPGGLPAWEKANCPVEVATKN